jgi:Zn-finger nucleic acid-binding protein
MHPLCPKCRSVSLEQAGGSLAHIEGERALRCPQCHGYFLPHRVVEHWETEPFVDLSEDEPVSMRPELDRRTGLCPMGHGILVRARVDLDPDQAFYLERCGLCHGVWLDRGEWQRLAASLYLDHLDDLWDPKWQRQRRSEKLQRGLDRSLADQLGETLYHDLVSVVERLRLHESRAQALAWIREHLDPHPQPASDLTNGVRLAKRDA